ncbi:GNAT family N-acetyltransferase [Microbacterium sp. gxy059]|uniref:GNAT family N-acetyltransferase n=1 Tax=Microbacterium sp. gxy059 TaxID=2957199 RepID=UPI003D95FDE4
MPESSEDPRVRVAPLAEIPAETLYGILRLRVDVFVVEQACAYPELDGRDLEPDARQLWIEDASGVAATLRLLDDGTALRIGRVVAHPRVRGGGAAAALMRRALAEAAGREIVLDAQAPLADWYGRFGFAPCGDEFLEDGIPHVPMRRPAAQAQGS